MWCAPVAALYQAVDVLGGHQPGQAGEAPVGHRRHRVGQVVDNGPALEQQAEAAPERGSEQLGAGRALTARLLHHAVRHVLRAEYLQAEGMGAEACTEKTSDGVEIVPYGWRLQATLLE